MHNEGLQVTRPFQFEIAESQAELEKALKHVVSASDKERLQMLYSYLAPGNIDVKTITTCDRNQSLNIK